MLAYCVNFTFVKYIIKHSADFEIVTTVSNAILDKNLLKRWENMNKIKIRISL